MAATRSQFRLIMSLRLGMVRQDNAMIAGVPEIPALDRDIVAWAAMSNDSFANWGPDNNRTAAGRFGYHGDGWIAVADMSMFTDNERPDWIQQPDGSLECGWQRSDEIRATVGYPLGDFIVGLGASYVGNLGGAKAQAAVHSWLCGPVQPWTGYQDPKFDHVAMLGYASWFSGPFDVQVIVTSSGTFEGRAGAAREAGRLRIGAHLEAHTGSWPTSPISESMGNERGLWVSASYHWSHVFTTIEVSDNLSPMWTAGARW